MLEEQATIRDQQSSFSDVVANTDAGTERGALHRQLNIWVTTWRT